MASARSTRLQSVGHRHSSIARVLKESDVEGSIAVAQGGEGSVATNGFWSALTIATTEKLPLLFVIEDNGYGISVPGIKQTPGGDIAANLASFRNLQVFDGDGTDPQSAAALIAQAVAVTRTWQGPALIRLQVPRLSGHSGQDTQAYKPPELIAAEKARDPLDRLKRFLVPEQITTQAWEGLEKQARQEVAFALMDVQKQSAPDPASAARHVFCEMDADGKPQLQRQGGVVVAGHLHRPGTRRAATRADAHQHGDGDQAHARCGAECQSARGDVSARMSAPRAACTRRPSGCSRSTAWAVCSIPACRRRASSVAAVGMAVAGLMPVPEIQFRKYADSCARATQRLRHDALAHARTASRRRWWCACPGGFFKCGDPWHSQTNEVAVGAWHRLAGRGAIERRRCGWLAARGLARQRSDHLLRASRDAGWGLGAPALSGRRATIVPFGRGETTRAGSQVTRHYLGCDGRAL